VAKQRKTKNLGLNRSKDSPKIYDYIENVLGIKEKICGRGKKGKLGKFGLMHKGKNPVPIREFYLLNAYIDPSSGKIVIKSRDGLQGACIKCDKAFRRARIKRWRKKYENMTKEEICRNYRKEYGNDKPCKPCGRRREPECFPVSITMETGLHNSCEECTKSYSESVGDRWAIYSPDGHYVLNTNDKDACRICNSKYKLHKDHIWPISKGGTDNRENLQILCSKHNLSKSATIKGIKSVEEIRDKMICERYLPILSQAKKEKWGIGKFELEIRKRVRKFIEWKRDLSDDQLLEFFIAEKERNNRKHSVKRCLKKFRKYCDTAILKIRESIELNQ